MVYSSLVFIYGFLPLSLIAYSLSPKRIKEPVLLLLSMIFAGFSGLKYLIFLAVFVLVNFFAAHFTAFFRRKASHLGKLTFALGIIFDFSVLLSFRTEMFAFLRGSWAFPDSFFPLGISLYTLSAVGYLIDVYRGHIRAERNPVRFALFIMMFPRIIMGPVLSYDSYLRIVKNRHFNMSRLCTGLTVFIVGLAKKVLVADNLYMLYSAIKSSDVSQLSVISAWLGAVAYILCLYFTLSGISDMGVGIGCCFGYRYPYSFNYPLFSSRIRYFTSKWHIQAIRWFRKYIIQTFADHVNNRLLNGVIFVGAWILAGFWYGSDLSSGIWGALMGTALILERKMLNSKMLRSTGIIYTFLATTIISVFLSEKSVTGAFKYIYAMLGGNRVLADPLTGYLLGAYIVAILIAMYAATDLFGNMIDRFSGTKARKIISIASPAVITFMLALCTAIITYSGSSGISIIRL